MKLCLSFVQLGNAHHAINNARVGLDPLSGHIYHVTRQCQAPEELHPMNFSIGCHQTCMYFWRLSIFLPVWTLEEKSGGHMRNICACALQPVQRCKGVV
jgi:hypothetical protein